MSQSLVVTGTTYTFPDLGDNNWGTDATAWAVAVTNGMLQKSGGSFTLTADADFGANFGLKSIYYKSRSATASTTGVVRLGNTEVIAWRNAANGANLSLTVSASNWLTYEGVNLADISSVQTFTNKTLTSPAISSPTFTGTPVISASLTPSADATYDLGTAVARWNDVYFGSHIYGPNGTQGAPGYTFGADTDSGIWRIGANNWALAAGNTKIIELATTGASFFGTTTLDTGLTGVVKATSGVLSAATILNADISASADISFSKLATLGSGNILVGNVSNVAASVAVTGDVTISNAGVTAIGASKVTNTMLAGSIAYSKLSLTGAILNADLAGSIAYSKLSLTGAILNADLAGSIAYSKLVLTTSIVNGDIALAAAIAGTKISPDFGSQNITTTGKLGVGGAVDTLSVLKIAGNPLSATNQLAVYAPFTSTSAATASTRGVLMDINTAAAAYTTAFANCFMASITAGAGSTITRAIMFDGSNGFTATGTISNRAFAADNQAFSGDYVLHFSSTNRSKFSGLVGVIQSTNNVTDALPTQAEMVTAFGAANLDTGLIGVIKDNNVDTNFFICISNGTSWYALKMTKGA